jgi:hypothetical protein
MMRREALEPVRVYTQEGKSMHRAPLTRGDLAIHVTLAFASHGIKVEEPEIIAGKSRNWTIGSSHTRGHSTASAYRRAADMIQDEIGAIYCLL